jgi:hypothetical protein
LTTSNEEQRLPRASFNIEPAPYVPFWEQPEAQENLYLVERNKDQHLAGQNRNREIESFTQRPELR